MFHLHPIDRAAAVSSEAQQYAQVLAAEKARVKSELRCPSDILHSGPMPIEDQAPLLHEQFLSIRFNNLAYEKIKAIDAALERLQGGEYGICEECDEPVSERRLKAIPWTRYCLRCQENFAKENGSPVFRDLKAA